MLNAFSGGLPAVPSPMVNISGMEIPLLEWGGKRVMPLGTVDQLHKRNPGTAKKNFDYQRRRFVDEKHVYTLNSGEAKSLGITAPRGLFLLTERGYLLLAESFQDDLSYEIREMLIECYFLVQAQALAPIVDLDDTETLQRMLLAHMSDKLALKKENLALTGAVTEKEAKIAVLQPQADEFERFMAAGNAATAEDFFKRLASRGYDVGLQRGFTWLREQGIVQQAPSVLPYQKCLNFRPLRFITHTVVTKLKNGKTRNDEQMLITPEGRVWLARRFEETYKGKKAK